MSGLPDVTTVGPVPAHATDDVPFKLSGFDFARFLHQCAANGVGRVLF